MLLLAATMVLMVSPVCAQEFDRLGDITSSGTSYHVFARSGEATVQVLVLGDGGSSGIYEVGEGTDLSELLVLTGGAGLRSPQRGETREVTVRLFRREGGSRTNIYEARLEDMLRSPGTYPQLVDGDLLEVESVMRQRIKWTEVIRTLASFASLGIALERVIRLLYDDQS